MGVSYELSQREGRVGGPEKPLSELGRKGYLQFWQARVATQILGIKNKSSLTVEEIAAMCWMLVDDVVIALKEMGVGEVRRKGAISISKARFRQVVSAHNINLTPPVHEDRFLEEWYPNTNYMVDV